jgi:hypothetical protein
MIKNRFASNCSVCKIPIAKGEGFAVNNADTGGKWKNYCKDHAPAQEERSHRPAPKQAPQAAAPAPTKAPTKTSAPKETSLEAELRAMGGIVNLKGKEYVLYKGLLMLAKKSGCTDIVVEAVEINMDKGFAIMRATVTGKLGTSVDYGDATQQNTGKMIGPHFIRMASTRAKARALRDWLGCGITALEELGSKGD